MPVLGRVRRISPRPGRGFLLPAGRLEAGFRSAAPGSGEPRGRATRNCLPPPPHVRAEPRRAGRPGACSPRRRAAPPPPARRNYTSQRPPRRRPAPPVAAGGTRRGPASPRSAPRRMSKRRWRRAWSRGDGRLGSPPGGRRPAEPPCGSRARAARLPVRPGRAGAAALPLPYRNRFCFHLRRACLAGGSKASGAGAAAAASRLPSPACGCPGIGPRRGAWPQV